MGIALVTIQTKERTTIYAPVETIEKMDTAAARYILNIPSLEEILEQNRYPCDYCGDYEYCAGHWGKDDCTGFIPASRVIEGVGPVDE